MNVLYNVFNSIISSTGFFIIFTLSMGFWGRLIIKALKIKKNNGYGDILPMIAIFSFINIICRYVSNFTVNMTPIFLFFYIFGALFSIFEILHFLLKKRKQYLSKFDILKDFYL
jgi:hypothetical protein